MPSRDPAKKVKDLLSCRIEEEERGPRRGADTSDDIGKWVSEHKDEARLVICETPEFSDMPFCETGHDSSFS